MATHTTGALPLREGLSGRVNSRFERAYGPAELAEWCAEPELGQRMARKGGAA